MKGPRYTSNPISRYRIVLALKTSQKLTRITKGAVDFIFGREGTAYFEGNVIASKGTGCVTANGRESDDSTLCKFYASWSIAKENDINDLKRRLQQ